MAEGLGPLRATSDFWVGAKVIVHFKERGKWKQAPADVVAIMKEQSEMHMKYTKGKFKGTTEWVVLGKGQIYRFDLVTSRPIIPKSAVPVDQLANPSPASSLPDVRDLATEAAGGKSLKALKAAKKKKKKEKKEKKKKKKKSKEREKRRKKKTSRKVVQSFSLGQRVELNWQNQGNWYPGQVTHVNPDTSVDVLCDDGDSELHVPPIPDRIRPAPTGKGKKRRVSDGSSPEAGVADGDVSGFSSDDAMIVVPSTKDNLRLALSPREQSDLVRAASVETSLGWLSAEVKKMKKKKKARKTSAAEDEEIKKKRKKRKREAAEAAAAAKRRKAVNGAAASTSSLLSSSSSSTVVGRVGGGGGVSVVGRPGDNLRARAQAKIQANIQRRQQLKQEQQQQRRRLQQLELARRRAAASNNNNVRTTLSSSSSTSSSSSSASAAAASTAAARAKKKRSANEKALVISSVPAHHQQLQPLVPLQVTIDAVHGVHAAEQQRSLPTAPTGCDFLQEVAREEWVAYYIKNLGDDTRRPQFSLHECRPSVVASPSTNAPPSSSTALAGGAAAAVPPAGRASALRKIFEVAKEALKQGSGSRDPRRTAPKKVLWSAVVPKGAGDGSAPIQARLTLLPMTQTLRQRIRSRMVSLTLPTVPTLRAGTIYLAIQMGKTWTSDPRIAPTVYSARPRPAPAPAVQGATAAAAAAAAASPLTSAARAADAILHGRSTGGASRVQLRVVKKEPVRSLAAAKAKRKRGSTEAWVHTIEVDDDGGGGGGGGGGAAGVTVLKVRSWDERWQDAVTQAAEQGNLIDLSLL